ncbi:MAG: S8 family serine peptidase [Planctomycetaceae bacterium]|nr:S8 family serine peptidase [Planctomycetaceae bacterium]
MIKISASAALFGGIAILLVCLPTLPAQPIDPSASDTPALRQQRVEELRQIARQEKAAALEIARQQGFAARRQVGGNVFDLIRIQSDRIFEYKTLNANAAISVAAAPLQAVPYNLDGSGQVLGIWDGGAVLTTHQEFDGRVTLKEAIAAVAHSTHVGGTLIAAGVVAAAKGMSPAALLDSYEFNEDLSEMTGRAMGTPGQAGMLQLSNHSYGFVTGWENSYNPPQWYGTWSGFGPNLESDMFGQYNTDARDWDALCYSAPYYLPFKAAGNDRSDAAPAAGNAFEYWYAGNWRTETYDPAIHPQSDGGSQGGYDTISTVDTAKNIILIGGVNDAVSGGQRSLAAAAMTGFSCWGPTDDGRIKPDIVANGTSVYSCNSSSPTAYYTNTGTSMASPNACGAAGLLLQHYGDLFGGQYLRAAALKALILHTADDLGTPGPDYKFGFGLMNTQAAADLLTAAHDWPQHEILVDNVLTTAVTSRTSIIDYNGFGPIKVTLCWTDPAGTAQTGVDNPARNLVNDLDVRVVSPDGATTWLPYVLDPANPAAAATAGNNIRDNVEQIYIESPGQTGQYVVTVSFKPPLTNNSQRYALVITGQSIVPMPPQAFDVTIQTQVDTAVTIGLDAADDGLPNPPGMLQYSILSLPNHGTLFDPNSGADPIAITAVPWVLTGGGGQVRYVPRAGCTLGAAFDYAADDGGSAPEGGLSNAATVTIGIAVAQVIYSADMNSDPNWTMQGQWQWGIPAGQGGIRGNPDPTGGFDGGAVIGYNLLGDYNSNIGRETAMMPALDCSAMKGVTLSFYRWLNVEATDGASIEASTDLLNWTVIWSHSNTITDSSWNAQTLDLSALADHQPTVYIRWVTGPTDRNKVYSGWNLDEVVVRGMRDAAVTPVPGDFEPDCDVDPDDLAHFVSYWLQNCGDCDADLTADGLVDLADLAVFAQYWLTEHSL